MVDLSTTYLGLKLKNPLVASASPLSEKVDTVRRLEQAGIAAVVMYSLFEEQVVQDSLKLDRDLSRGADSHAEASSYLPDLSLYTGKRYNIGPEAYAERLNRLKSAVSIPVIGSLNGISSGGWVGYAALIEQAGASALELNIYNIPSDPAVCAADLEDQYITLVRAVRAKVTIPLAVKLSPFFTALPSFARRLVAAGADGLVLFNRFYQPDFDLEALEVTPNLVLSSSQELRLPLRWIAILYGRITADFALTTGVHTSEDLLKAVMAGASAVMMASALLKRGVTYPAEVLSGLQAWMETKEYDSIEQMKGSMSQQSVARPEAFERANYMKVLESYSV